MTEPVGLDFLKIQQVLFFGPGAPGAFSCYNEGMEKRAKILFIIKWGLGVGVLIAITLALTLNRTVISDFTRGMFYQPTEEMAVIRDKLKLTEEGARIFNASFPVLEEREGFNLNCRSHDASIYILGCYTNGGIFVYNITDETFDGIRELTAAHELLHAVYARLSDSERISLSVLLEEIYRKNSDTLGEELALYEGSERYDELHSRVGTEISDLPEELSKHYARFFENQDLIVSYYNQYISPFRELKAKFARLEDELKSLSAEIEAKKANYEARAESYNKTVEEFNNCAETAGCFNSEYAFRTRRAEILREQAELNGLFEEVNRLVVTYNEKVDEYNQAVAKNEELTNIVNSNAEVEKINEISQ